MLSSFVLLEVIIIPFSCHSTHPSRTAVSQSVQGEDDDELTFPREAIIRVIGKADDGWWEGIYEKRVGYFPGNYVTPLD